MSKPGSKPGNTTLTGPVNNARNKPDLVNIALGLGIDPTGNKEPLLRRIQGHLEEHRKELESNPQFQALYHGRAARSAQSGEKPAENSAPKAAALEKAMGPAPTPAHQRLLSGKITAQPKPQYTRLELGGTKAAAGKQGTSTEASSPLSELDGSDAEHDASKQSSKEAEDPDTPGPDATDVSETPAAMHDEDEHDGSDGSGRWGPPVFTEVEGEAQFGERQRSSAEFGELPTKAGKNDKDVVVIVHSDVDGPTELYVPADAADVNMINTDGGTVYTTQLSHLLPAALNTHSPMKNRQGRLSIRGRVTAGKVPIGSFSDIAAGTSRTLALQSLNRYKLEDRDGLLCCEVFFNPLEESARVKGSTGVPAQPVAALAQPATFTDGLGAPPAPTTDTKAATGSQDAFWAYLGGRLGAPEKERPKVSNIGDVLERALEIKAALGKLENGLDWKVKNGYKVPEDDLLYPGRAFAKDDVYRALQFGKTAAAGYVKAFSDTVRREHPIIQKWYSDPQGPHSKTFSKMSIKEFDSWLNAQKLEKDAGKGARPKTVKELIRKGKEKQPVNDGSRRRKRSHSDVGGSAEEEEEDEVKPERKKKGKGKQKARESSEDLGSSDSR